MTKDQLVVAMLLKEKIEGCQITLSLLTKERDRLKEKLSTLHAYVDRLSKQIEELLQTSMPSTLQDENRLER